MCLMNRAVFKYMCLEGKIKTEFAINLYNFKCFKRKIVKIYKKNKIVNIFNI